MLEGFSRYLGRFYDYTNRRSVPFVLFLLAANLILKFLYVDHSSFYLDEAWHTFFSQKPVGDIIRHASEDPNPPLYNLLIGGWLRIFDVSAFSIRSFSVVMSSLTAVVLFYLARKHVNIQTAIWGTLIYTISNLQYYYSHEARVYALVGLLAVLSFYSFLNLLKQPGWKHFLLYTLFSSLLLYTHTIPILLLSAQFIVALFFFKTYRKGFWLSLTGQVIATFLFALWIVNSPYYQQEATTWIEPPNWDEIYAMIVAYLNSPLLVKLYALVLLATVVFVIFTGWLKRAEQNQKLAFTFLLCWALLPVIEMLIFSHTIVSIFEWRYTLFSTLGLYLLLAYMISLLAGKNLPGMLILLFIVVHSSFFLEIKHGKNANWKKVVAYTEERKDENTLVLICPYYQYVAYVFYSNIDYFKDYDQTVNLLESEHIHGCADIDYLQHINERDYEKIILVASDKDEVASAYHDYLSSKYDAIDSIDQGGALAWTFDTSGDDDSYFLVDFDEYHAANNMHTVVKTDLARSGKLVSRIDTVNSYSSGFGRDAKYMANYDSVIVSAWGYSEDHDLAKATLVGSFSGQDTTYSWHAAKNKDSIADNGWWRITLKIPFIKMDKPDDRFITYMWNEGKSTILVDDLAVRFK